MNLRVFVPITLGVLASLFISYLHIHRGLIPHIGRTFMYLCMLPVWLAVWAFVHWGAKKKQDAARG